MRYRDRAIALEAEGYRINTYTDGVSALDGFRTEPPDLAILDIKMPRMDGMETLRRLREKSDLPVICRPGMHFVAQPGHTHPAKAAAPMAHRARHGAERPGNPTRRVPFVRQQNDPGTKHVALFRRRRPHSRFKHRTILRRQPDFRGFGNHPNV